MEWVKLCIYYDNVNNQLVSIFFRSRDLWINYLYLPGERLSRLYILRCAVPIPNLLSPSLDATVAWTLLRYFIRCTDNSPSPLINRSSNNRFLSAWCWSEWMTMLYDFLALVYLSDCPIMSLSAVTFTLRLFNFGYQCSNVKFLLFFLFSLPLLLLLLELLSLLSWLLHS